jgi:hypothetical protein
MGIGFALVILGSTLATRPGQVVEGPGVATVERAPG